MLSENLKKLRREKGFSQEELAIKLNVVRQTVSKWEKGLSVPDAEMLIRIAEALETSVNVLLGNTVEADPAADLHAVAAKLELLNEQFACQNERRRKIWKTVFLLVGLVSAGMLVLSCVEVFNQQAMAHAIQESSEIIGGADGPTAIIVARTSGWGGKFLTAVLGLVVAVFGFVRMGRKM